MKAIEVTRSAVILAPDLTHKLARPWLINVARSSKTAAPVMTLSEDEVHESATAQGQCDTEYPTPPRRFQVEQALAAMEEHP